MFWRLTKELKLLEVVQRQGFLSHHLHTSCRCPKGYKLSQNIKDCYSVLRVPENSSSDEVRQAYLQLAKEYHPDSGSTVADPRKFAQVDEAYRAIMNHRQKTSEIKIEEEITETNFNIKHTAPQHRQYLSFEGVGYGTPSKRQKQYQQYKAERATENVYQYKTGKMAAFYETAMVTKDKQETRKKMIRNAMERLVEDLISDSMAKGEFDNLPGQGKPLEYSSHNPMVDVTTHNLNKILIQNGYVPEWVSLKRDISLELGLARRRLLEDRIRLGPEPLQSIRKTLWDKSVNQFKDSVESVNAKINKMNMVAPTMRQQMVPYSKKHIKKEVDIALETYQFKVERGDLDTKKPPAEPVIQYKMPDPNDETSVNDVWNNWKALFKSVTSATS